MDISEKIIQGVRRVLPSPFSIAIILTVLTYLLALLFTAPAEGSGAEPAYWLQVWGFWRMGFWELLSFTMQMMLILVLGHALAISRPVSKMIGFFVRFCNNTANAAFLITFFTVAVALLNWGLGLIFGAVFARKVAEHARRQGIQLNYPLIGAAGYSGLMVWHGGLSGSAPVLVAGHGHFLEQQIGIIPIEQTVFSSMNISISLALLILLPILMYLLGRSSGGQVPTFVNEGPARESKEKLEGAERLDHQKWPALLVGGGIVLYSVYEAFSSSKGSTLSFLDLNYINFTLFGLGILLHGNFHSFLSAVERAIVGSAGILIQFPLYAGIMGMMKYSGLVAVYADFFINIANADTLPFFTFLSAGLVNIFVPSGGGQWAVQGPIIVEAAERLASPLAKNVMAMAYGDQLTNMLQPFWALPLLGITGLKAKDILPYTFLLFIFGLLIFSMGLMWL